MTGFKSSLNSHDYKAFLTTFGYTVTVSSTRFRCVYIYIYMVIYICIYITETFYRHPYIIYTSLYLERYIYLTDITDNSLFYSFLYAHLKQVSHRKAINSFMQSHISILYFRSGQGVRWYWANFQCRGVLLVWINVGQGPTALAIVSGGGCFLIYQLSLLSPSL